MRPHHTLIDCGLKSAPIQLFTHYILLELRKSIHSLPTAYHQSLLHWQRIKLITLHDGLAYQVDWWFERVLRLLGRSFIDLEKLVTLWQRQRSQQAVAWLYELVLVKCGLQLLHLL